jgi:hypothetical protein
MKQKVAHITQQLDFGMTELSIQEIQETFLAFVCPQRETHHCQMIDLASLGCDFSIENLNLQLEF